MIETLCEQIIKELGVTGLLILGLYWTLGKHLLKMSNSLTNINHELGEIITLLKASIEKKDG